MKGNVFTIIKKELARFFGDKRLAFCTILLPGLMIYVLYTLMGQGLTSMYETGDEYAYQICAVNMPDSVAEMTKELPVQVENVTENEIADCKGKIEAKETDLLLVFPVNFDETVKEYDMQSMGATESAPAIEAYYNSTKVESSGAYGIMLEVFDGYESALANKFDVNVGETDYDLASEKDATGQIFSMMLPMLLMIFMFSGCMSIAPESIAGEKERGTIATLLVTPMKRSHLAFGKIISLSIIGLLSGISSFLGTMLSLPSLMEGTSADVYTSVDYVMLLLIVLSTILMMVAALSVLSAFAKSVKEASNMVLPLMIIVIVIAVTSMMNSGAQSEWFYYLIPFYNSVQCMTGIFGFAYETVNIVIALGSNIVYALLLVFGLTRIFDSEKIMYL